VRKLALGKSLRTLLNGTRVPGQPNGTVSNTRSEPEAELSSGLGSLLRGERKATSEPERETASDETPLWQKWRWVKWLLLAADLLLLVLACLVVIKSSGRLSFGESLLCCAALGIGATLAVLALIARKK